MTAGSSSPRHPRIASLSLQVDERLARILCDPRGCAGDAAGPCDLRRTSITAEMAHVTRRHKPARSRPRRNCAPKKPPLPKAVTAGNAKRDAHPIPSLRPEFHPARNGRCADSRRPVPRIHQQAKLHETPHHSAPACRWASRLIISLFSSRCDQHLSPAGDGRVSPRPASTKLGAGRKAGSDPAAERAARCATCSSSTTRTRSRGNSRTCAGTRSWPGSLLAQVERLVNDETERNIVQDITRARAAYEAPRAEVHRSRGEGDYSTARTRCSGC